MHRRTHKTPRHGNYNRLGEELIIKKLNKGNLKRETQYEQAGMDLLMHELFKEIYFTLDIKYKLRDKPKLILELWMKINPAPADPVDPSPSLLHQDCPLHCFIKTALCWVAFSADKNPVILSQHRYKIAGSNLVVVCWLNSPWKLPPWNKCDKHL